MFVPFLSQQLQLLQRNHTTLIENTAICIDLEPTSLLRPLNVRILGELSQFGSLKSTTTSD